MNFLSQRVMVYSEPCDMRKQYDGLLGLVRGQCDVLSGSLFLFVSKDRRRAKCLFWDGTGLNIWMKRMEENRFAAIWERQEMTVNEVKLFFEGSSAVVHRLSVADMTAKYSA